MKALDIYSPSYFTTSPECQGQMMLVSYAIDSEQGVIIARSENQSTRATSYTAYSCPESVVWDPWNSAPELGAEIGPCVIT